MRKICIFTSTRADWGLQRGVADQIQKRDDVELQLLVSGTHLSELFGMTVSEIESDGHVVNERVDILKFDDSAEGISSSMGLALAEYGAALNRLKPDVLVVLGDRYETFCVAAAAQIHRIPVAHIHGGETTEGAVDEAFRHSITKMAQVHFPCCEEYRRRIIQLGENPDRVFNIGALGVENIRTISMMEREELANSIGFSLDAPFFLVTFHPVTLEQSTAEEQFENLLEALGRLPDHKIIITGANADTDGSVINAKIQQYVISNPERGVFIDSLGLRRYLTAMKYCDAVIGNSSSGILEAPAFKVPTVNIGDRQKGRVRADSIIDCASDSEAIFESIQRALSLDFRRALTAMVHPCEKENTAAVIAGILHDVDVDGLLKKSFHNLPVNEGSHEN